MRKVLLGMSGGVDSSVSAILLKNAGYEVYGATMQLYEGGCCNLNSDLDAKNVCKNIGIEHCIIDYRNEFKENVINNFIEEYSKCKTPNPCIECNRYLKFGAMYNKAKSLGIDYISTGHYAKTEYSDKYARYVLKKSNNIAKDQSYVLYSIPKELLSKIIFPLGEFESKEEIRNIAKEYNLKVANKPDSEDICFIPNGNYKSFLEQNSNLTPNIGDIVNTKGKILGKHKGLYNYTIGQRKGLGISYKVPLFVIGFNKERNEVIVGEESELYQKEVFVKDVNLLLVDDIDKPIKVNVKTRYSRKEAKAVIEKVDISNLKNKIIEKNNLYNEYEIMNLNENSLNEDYIVKITFDEPQARITPGQSAVFYIDDIVLGGGKIMQ